MNNKPTATTSSSSANHAYILKLAEQEVVDRGAGVTSVPLIGDRIPTDRLSIGMTVVPVGGAIPFHTHNSEEFILLLEGEAECEVDGKRHPVRPLDATYVPQGIVHRFVNVGDVPMRILWVYSTTDAQRTLVETGRSMGHLGSYE